MTEGAGLKNLKPVVIFIHGFGSSPKCWDRLISLLKTDERITAQYDLRCFGYPTLWFNFNPLRRIPPIREIAESLREFIDSPEFYDRELTLVGHSQGGLVIQSYLVALLEAGQGERLAPLRQVILIATPSLGSTLLSPVRKVFSWFAFNPQERSLRVLDEEIARIRSVVLERVVGARAGDAHSVPVPVHCFYGLRDGIVKKASAVGEFGTVTPLDGDHFTIIQPEDRNDERYREFVEALLEPTGHPNIFEIDLFEQDVVVRPALETQPFTVTHGTASRTVFTDNIACVRRLVTFAVKNRCRAPFTLRYRTRSQGYIRPTMSHDNEASPVDRERYDDTGTDAVFQFTPAPGETYVLKVDVYKGFNEGHRDIHCHLGRHSYYKEVRCKLDLSPYLAAGYTISQAPKLYLHPNDPENHDICEQRGLGAPVEPLECSASGTWTWELRSVRQGVVDLLWDVALPERDQAKR